MRNTEEALKWIVSILKVHEVPFQIVGGFAARLFGSERELADIDIDIPDADLDTIASIVNDYIVSGPEPYVDENWNLTLMTLKYEGQLIDISGEAQIFNKNTREWEQLKTNFDDSDRMEIYGITVPVIKKAALVAYKSKLLRDVDREDIKALLDS